MIQRIQSLFLFLAAASFIGLFALPFASSEEAMEGLFADNIYSVKDHIILIILSILGAVLALVSIFLYKRRSLQIKLGYGVITLSVLLLLVAFLLVFQDTQSELSSSIKEGLGIGLPVFSIIFILFANRFIKKDDKLVKSMDRLR